MSQIILSPRETEDRDRLARAASDRGWSVCQMEKWRVTEDMLFEQDLAIYGEPLFCRIVAAQIERVLLEPPHDWLCKLPISVTHRKIKMLRFDELRQVPLPCFLKAPDEKLFPAAVYEDITELTRRSDIDPSQHLIMSDVINFRKEYRVHLLEGTAVSGSRYSVGGELSIDSRDSEIVEAQKFAEKVFNTSAGSTPPAVVIDVGVTDSGEWAVVEANPCFGAGIYGGDDNRILDVLLKACRMLDEVDESVDQFKFPLEIN